MQRFEDFGLSTEMLNALSKKGFEEPSEIQKLVVPELLKERNRENCSFWYSNTGNY